MNKKRDWIFQKEIEYLEKFFKVKLNDDQKSQLDNFFLRLQDEIEESYADSKDNWDWDINDLD